MGSGPHFFRVWSDLSPPSSVPGSRLQERAGRPLHFLLLGLRLKRGSGSRGAVSERKVSPGHLRTSGAWWAWGAPGMSLSGGAAALTEPDHRKPCLVLRPVGPEPVTSGCSCGADLSFFFFSSASDLKDLQLAPPPRALVWPAPVVYHGCSGVKSRQPF